MDEVDEALSAIDNGEDGYWIIETLAMEVRCNRTTISRLRDEITQLRRATSPDLAGCPEDRHNGR